LLFNSFTIGQNDSIILPEVMITAPFNQPIQNAVFIIKHLPDSNEISVLTPLTDLMANDGVLLAIEVLVLLKQKYIGMDFC